MKFVVLQIARISDVRVGQKSMSFNQLGYWIDGQVQALGVDGISGQLGVFALVLIVALLIAALIGRLSRILPLDRPGASVADKAPTIVAARPSVEIAATRAAAASPELRSLTIESRSSARPKKKKVKATPKRYAIGLDDHPSDPMFLPPFDAAVPYRDRISAAGPRRRA